MHCNLALCRWKSFSKLGHIEHMGDLDLLIWLSLAGHEFSVRAKAFRNNQNSALPGVWVKGIML